MKRFLPTLLLAYVLLLVSGTSFATNKSSVAVAKNIKCVRKYSVEEENGQMKKVELIDSIKYDRHGNIIEQFSYYAGKRRLMKKVTTSFNENGFTTDAIQYSLRGNKQLKRCIYDKNGHLVKESEYGNDTLLSTSCYNAEGWITEHVFYETDGRVFEKSFWEYDYENQLLHSTKYDAAGNLIYKQKHIKKGDTLEVVTDDNGSQSSIVTIFDEKGNKQRKIYYNGFEKSSEFKYGKNNNVTEQVFYSSDDKIQVRVLYMYDDQDRLVEYAEYQDGNQVRERRLTSYSGNFKTDTILKYNTDGTEKYKRVMKWDMDRLENLELNMVEEKIYYEGALSRQSISTYDAEGNCSRLTEVFKDGTLVPTRTTKISKDGRYCEDIIMGSILSPNQINVEKYDQYGNMLLKYKKIENMENSLRGDLYEYEYYE